MTASRGWRHWYRRCRSVPQQVLHRDSRGQQTLSFPSSRGLGSCLLWHPTVIHSSLRASVEQPALCPVAPRQGKRIHLQTPFKRTIPGPFHTTLLPTVSSSSSCLLQWSLPAIMSRVALICLVILAGKCIFSEVILCILLLSVSLAVCSFNVGQVV